ANLYADSRLWLNKGWLDYFAPQLYWGIDQSRQSFPVLLKWWAEQNLKGRVLAPGMDSTKAGRQWSSTEIIRQIRLTRGMPGVGGHVHWSMKALMRNGQLVAELEKQLYDRPALTPACAWLDNKCPSKPQLTVAGSSRRANWKPATKDDVWLWVVQTRTRTQWTTKVLSAGDRGMLLDKMRPEIIALTAVDRCGNASPPAVLELDRR
ncbi:MAG: hypothetical protein ACREIC_11510, partial [Limisphaerales bacterium]